MVNTRLLEQRNKAKGRKPNFLRQDANRNKSLEKKWIKPKGMHSKMRIKLRSRRVWPSSGYCSPNKVKGLTRKGFQPVLVNNLKDLVVDRAHIYFLDVLLFSGIIGLLGYIGLISIVFIKMKSKILISSLLIYLVWSQFQNQSIVHLIYFWLLVGLVDESST